MKGKRIIVWTLVAALLFAVCAVAVACDGTGKAPETLEEAKARFEAAEYFVDIEVYDPEEDAEEIEEYGFAGEVLAETEGETEMFYATLFVSEERAKAYLEERYDSFAEDCESDREEGFNMAFGRAGKWVYYGTKNAVAVFLKPVVISE